MRASDGAEFDLRPVAAHKVSIQVFPPFARHVYSVTATTTAVAPETFPTATARFGSNTWIAFSPAFAGVETASHE